MPSTRKNNKNNRKTVKRYGGVKSPSSKKEAVSAKKLKDLTENPPGVITSGMMSTTMPFSITAAKKAIDFANANPDDKNARKDAENKIAIADFLTGLTRKRQNWRNERRDSNSPNSRAIRANVGHNWYATSPNSHWELNP